jgi:hypothetical protein
MVLLIQILVEIMYFLTIKIKKKMIKQVLVERLKIMISDSIEILL